MIIAIHPDRRTFLDLAQHGNLIPVCLEILADTETPVSALAKLANPHSPSFLLESVEGGERWARYSFLGTSAAAQIIIDPVTIVLHRPSGTVTFPHHGDPLPYLKDLMASFHPVTLPELPRFWGGLVGYFTYEMVTFFEDITLPLPHDLPLAHLVLTDDLLIFDNLRHSLLLLKPVHFGSSSVSAATLYDAAVHHLYDLLHKLKTASIPEPSSQGFQKTRRLRPILDEATFCAKVATIKDHILAGDVIQAVLSHPFLLHPAPDPWHLYRAQRFVNPSPYMFSLHLGNLTLVGSSPETMVRLENGTAILRPIAGTRPRGRTEQQDRQLADELLADHKERAEHLMLVDLGRNDLGRVAETGTVQVTELMVVERYSHVMHLVSNITCELRRDCDAWDLIRATFPAGTLTGAPKIRAMEILSTMEQRPRGPYGGAVGYISYSGNLDLAITIRTASITDQTLLVQAGAGIVADSDPEKEYQETINKAQSVQRAVELVTAMESPLQPNPVVGGHP